MKLAAKAKLGKDLVVQTPYGNSGRTTFFVAGEKDWDKYADKMASEAAQGDEAHQSPAGHDRRRAPPATARWSGP